MNFAAVDLNLMRVFDAMMVELNTTRAGDRLGLSQPAVSSALGRLRHITGDALFVREGNRMVATPRAEELARPIRSALRQLEEALAAAASFDPASATHTMRIIGSDYFSTLLLPPLARAVRVAAPGLVLQMLDRPTGTIVAQLGDGAADCAVDARIEVPDWIGADVLFQSVLVTVARADDPRIAEAGVRPGDRLPPDLFCSLPQVLMSMDGGRKGPMDRELEAVGLKRRIVLTVPQFHTLALAVAETDLIGNLPVHFARHVAAQLGLSLYRPPLDPPALDVMLYWHRRHDADPAQAWLRDRIFEVFRLDSDT